VNIDLQALEARHPAATPGAPAALRALNLQLAAGEQVAIIGPSGAGKTTLLQVLACAQPPTQGTLQLAGVNPGPSLQALCAHCVVGCFWPRRCRLCRRANVW